MLAKATSWLAGEDGPRSQNQIEKGVGGNAAAVRRALGVGVQRGTLTLTDEGRAKMFALRDPGS